MPNTENKTQGILEKTVRDNPLAVFLALLSAITALANLWSVGKLAPIAERQSILETRVSANNIALTNSISRSEFTAVVDNFRTSISEWKSSEDQRLDRIERKLDEL